MKIAAVTVATFILSNRGLIAVAQQVIIIAYDPTTAIGVLQISSKILDGFLCYCHTSYNSIVAFHQSSNEFILS